MLIFGVFPPKIGDCFPPNMGWFFQIMDFPLLILMDDLGKINYLRKPTQLKESNSRKVFFSCLVCLSYIWDGWVFVYLMVRICIKYRKHTQGLGWNWLLFICCPSVMPVLCSTMTLPEATWLHILVENRLGVRSFRNMWRLATEHV